MTKLLSLALALCLSLAAQANPLPAVQPPGYELVFSGDPVSLEAGRLSFIIRNNTGADAQVLLIPRLERQTPEGAWEEVPFLARVGFCGVADPLPAGDRACSIEPLELWGILEDGVYRLGYEVTAAGGTKTSAQGEFVLEAALQICGYPLADS